MGHNQKQVSVHDLIVVGASAGGVKALTYLVQHLPTELNAAVLIVLHVHSQSPCILPQILNNAGNLPASAAQDGEAIEKGRIYVAPPDYHLRVKPGYLHLTRGPKENRHRPAIDLLFRSAAQAYGKRVVAVVLTGMLDDGTAGLMAVKMRGGVAVVQDPDDAMYAGMPRSALENVEDIDYVLPMSEIPSILVALANTPMAQEPENFIQSNIEPESDIGQFNMEVEDSGVLPGKPSTFICPDCGGTLWEHEEGKLLRFKCHVGHAFGAETLLALQSEELEEALWTAVRALQEKAMLSERMASRMRDRNLTLAAKRMEQEAADAQERSTVIREVLERADKYT
ncbi:MAG: chemotaxis protein CheB [Mojavia pulchra JT2-VF2]|jgi:two-component system chemotaxis response regulator CheB|uniref:protein-glutamate methylesterase n=1 Tax=Mojavia pulchra JT2-VF2 TaxID=287848 RepID=A0A951UHQ9_9NOST|nr:chemotaxis protein CheB [Mojavia pulchra JT2-VF2]